jgi:acyl-CoA thioesterase-1
MNKPINLILFLGLIATLFSYSLFADTQITKSTVHKILFLGDSLTEGHMLSKKDSFPSLIEVKLKSEFGKEQSILNGGVSGSTTASGLSRLRWFMKAKPTVLVLALGANDGLRGFSLDESYKNLEKIIDFAIENKLKVLLCGMKMPPNYGKKYQDGFLSNFEKLKAKYKIPYFPFLLKGVGGKTELNLDDGIHPNKKGYKIIAENLYKKIKEEFYDY